MWVIWYHDAEVEPDVFIGEGAEEAARQTFAQRKLNWNCVLLKDIEHG